MLTVKGWRIGAHPLFVSQMSKLIEATERERRKNPARYREGANAKLVAAVLKLVAEVIPERPDGPEHRQGNTLGKEHQHWFRAKLGGGRFRLFFRYSSTAKIIIYAWLNDQDSLRAYGRKSEAYNVFSKMLAAGNPPGDWAALLAASSAPDAGKRFEAALEEAKDLGRSS